jgi:hypothetical protein
MVAIHVTGRITEDRQLIIQLPDDAPIGAVDVVIQPQPQAEPVLTDDEIAAWEAKREAIREKMRAAGLLGEAHMPPDDLVAPSWHEVKRIIDALPISPKTSLDYINEDREERL